MSAFVASRNESVHEIGEDRAGGDIGIRVGKVLRNDRQRLVDAVAAGGEHGRGDGLLELFDLVGNGPVAGNGVVDRVKAIGLDLQFAAVQCDHQFAQVLPFLSGLDHRRAVVDDDRLAKESVAVTSDHHVDARDRRQDSRHLRSLKRPSLPFCTPPWLRAMTTFTFSVSRRTFTISRAASI